MLKFEPDEVRLCREVLGLYEQVAIREIKNRDCFPFVARRDRDEIPYPNKCAHSYRVNLALYRGKVVNSWVG